MNNLTRLFLAGLFGVSLISLRGQTNTPTAFPASAKDFTAPAPPPPEPVDYTNKAIVPLPRTETGVLKRVDLVLQRATNNPGKCDLVFIGDSITQGWEGKGKNVWTKYYGKRKALNFGVGGDRTQHVLWRYEHGQLDGLKPKVAIIMIGTNNSNGKDNTEAEILEGVEAIVTQTRQRLPDTKIILMGIFPRGSTFSAQRGKILEVNEALAKMDNDKTIFYLDIGPQLIEADGSISKKMMSDYLHPNEPGYEIWAAAMEPTIKRLLGHSWL